MEIEIKCDFRPFRMFAHVVKSTYYKGITAKYMGSGLQKAVAF